MKIHRFIGSLEDPAIAKQIKDVLRLEPGEEIILSDGKGTDTLVELVSLNPMEGRVVKKLDPVVPEREVHLYLAILKKENFELAVQKATECGVTSITPVITSRTVKTGLNMKRLEKIAKEASEQCGRSVVPRISAILNFSSALAFASAAEEKIIFHPGNVPYSPKKEATSVSIFIGPEGGYTDKELDEARAGLFLGASLGDLVLRGETAAMIASYRAVNCI